MQAHFKFLTRVLGQVLGAQGFEILGPLRESVFLTGSEILQKYYLLEPARFGTPFFGILEIFLGYFGDHL